MKKIFNIMFLCAFASLFAGCDKEESLFEGSDAHILSFTLTTADGVKYSASIDAGNILVTVPSGTSLSGASVEYDLCENASINPDPASISDWNSEYLFRVEAYNGGYESYRYSVKYTENVENETIVFTTQAEIDAFASSGTTIVNGSVIIGAEKEPASQYDTIKNVEALASLKEIGANLVIRGTYKGSNVDGLANLERAGGLYVGREDEKCPLEKGFDLSLPNLVSATDIIVVCDSVARISFPSLATVNNKFYVNSKSVEEIETGALQECLGDVTIEGKSQGSSSNSGTSVNQKLTELSFPALKTVYGNLSVNNIWSLSNADFPLLSEVKGSLSLTYLYGLKELELPSLQMTGGDMKITSNDAMTLFSAPSLKNTKSLSIASSSVSNINLANVGLGSLEEVDGDFSLKFGSMENLSFPELRKIAGKLELNNFYFLETLSLASLEECGELSLSSIANIKELDVSNVKIGAITLSSCVRLAQIKSPKAIDDLSITNSSAKPDEMSLTEMAGLDTIRGTLKISANSFTEIVIPHIKVIGTYSQTAGTKLKSLKFPDTDSIGTLGLQNLTALTTFEAPKLKCTDSFSMRGLREITQINMPLYERTGTFTFDGAISAASASRSKITNMDGFYALKHADQVTVRYCGNLTDFTGLASLAENLSDESAWVVNGNKYNPTLADMKNGKYTMQ